MNLLQSVLTKFGITVKVSDDNTGWTPVVRAGTGYNDRDWYEFHRNITDALTAWRENFLIRQVVRLTTAYVVGEGITVTSAHPWVGGWVEEFWNDPQNRIADRLTAWCDELTRSGELFIALFSNRVTGMQYVRVIPAGQIERVVTDPDDYEKELEYLQTPGGGAIEPRRWPSAATAAPDEPALLHFTVNKPVGATRGESDLAPLLPWAQRYTEWLKERARFNRIRNDLAIMHVRVANEADVEAKRRQYRQTPPTGGSILVTGKSEEISFPSANIQGYDAAPDGLALRLAFAAGANIPLHFLAEGSSATRTTAAEMGDPTHRHYRQRQKDFAAILKDLTVAAYRRYVALRGLREPADLQIVANAPDVSRADNAQLAQAAQNIVTALAAMKAQGWIDDRSAMEIAFKFTGEKLTAEHIARIKEAANDQTIR